MEQIRIEAEPLVKKQNTRILKWSWEMVGTFLIMIESMKKDLMCPRKKDCCQPAEPEVTLVLDLDETLIHSTSVRTDPKDEEILVRVGNSLEKYYVKLRPFLKEFLERLSKIFELVIFTASIKEYADKVIDYIDPDGYIKRRFYRDSCTKKDGIYYKDLTKVNPDLSKVFIIDNSTSGMSLNQDNGLLIKSWYTDPNDKELKYYSKFLTKPIKSDIRRRVKYLTKKYPNHVLNQH